MSLDRLIFGRPGQFDRATKSKLTATNLCMKWAKRYDLVKILASWQSGFAILVVKTCANV